MAGAGAEGEGKGAARAATDAAAVRLAAFVERRYAPRLSGGVSPHGGFLATRAARCYILRSGAAPAVKRAGAAAVAAGTAVAAAAAVVLALPLFYDTVVDEPPPPPALSLALGDVRAGLTMEEFSSMPDGERAPLVAIMPDSTRSMVMDEAARSPTAASDAMPAGDAGAAAAAPPAAARAGQFEGVAGHRAAGTALLISAGGAEYLRFEDFEVTNGPDLRVYLTRGGDVGDGLHLAKLKGSRGDQNYDITGLGAGEYDTVVVYCQPFGVHFAHAVLSDPGAAPGGG